MKICDLLTVYHKKDTFRGFAIASLKSSSSTFLRAGECPVDRSTVQVLHSELSILHEYEYLLRFITQS